MAIVGKWWDAKLFAGAYNVSGDSKNILLTYNADMLDGAVFGNASKVSTPGLTSIELQCAGLLPAISAADLKEKQFFDNIGLANIPVTVMPTNTPVEGSLCYFFQAAQATYQTFGPHGALMPFNLTMQNGASGHNLIRGYVLEPGTAAKTITGTGTGFEIAAVTAAQYLYAILHVTAVDTPTTLDVIIESDVDGDFTTPATVATFTQVTTALTSQYLTRVAGPVTDTFYRAKWTIAGTSYTFACAMGIAA